VPQEQHEGLHETHFDEDEADAEGGEIGQHADRAGLR
jgi:hypothetical protein